MNIPDNLFYTKDHEWIRINNEIAIIGITEHAQSELGDIIFIEFFDVGLICNASDTIGTIEAVKTVADIYSPMKGTISKNNNNLENNPEFVNHDPYGTGWIVELHSITIDKSILLSAEDYKKII